MRYTSRAVRALSELCEVQRGAGWTARGPGSQAGARSCLPFTMASSGAISLHSSRIGSAHPLRAVGVRTFVSTPERRVRAGSSVPSWRSRSSTAGHSRNTSAARLSKDNNTDSGEAVDSQSEKVGRKHTNGTYAERLFAHKNHAEEDTKKVHPNSKEDYDESDPAFDSAHNEGKRHGRNFSKESTSDSKTDFSGDPESGAPFTDPKSEFGPKVGVPHRAFVELLADLNLYFQAKFGPKTEDSKGLKLKGIWNTYGLTLDQQLNEVNAYFKTFRYKFKREFIVAKMYPMQYLFGIILAYKLANLLLLIGVNSLVDGESMTEEHARQYMGDGLYDTMLDRFMKSDPDPEKAKKNFFRIVQLKETVDSLILPVIVMVVLTSSTIANRCTIPLSNKFSLFILGRIKPNILEKGNAEQKKFITGYEHYLTESLRTGDVLVNVESRIRTFVTKFNTVSKAVDDIEAAPKVKRAMYYAGPPRPSLSPNIRRYLRQ